MDEFLIGPSPPAVAGFRGTQFVAVWPDADGNVKGQMLSTEGKTAGPAFGVSFPGPPQTKRRLPVVAETAMGFVVAWNEQLPGGVFQLKLRTFDADTLSGPETQVGSAEVESLIRPALARLDDGGFMVAWADKRADERIRAQRFGLDGEKAGPEFRANTVAGLHRVPMAATLTGGRIAIGWRARLQPALSLHLQLFDGDRPAGGEQATGIEITEAAMAPLDSGRFVVVHVRSAGDGEPGFETTVAQASVFEASGAFSGRRFPATAGRILSSWPAVVPLSGERFVLAWTESSVDAPGSGTNVMARLFSTNGPIGNPVRVNTSTGHQRFSLSATATAGPDGETFFAAWADDSDASRPAKGRMLVIPAGGF
ncbi:MAG TPA: hypothetical protein VF744_10825 [Beijerinckiaceae bacterium]|jgi:hypothetical protein